MRFTRTFKSGARDSDPRQRTNAEFVCDACGYVHWEQVDPTSFNMTQEKKCPKCGCVSKDDKIRNLLSKKETLLQRKTEIQKQIDEICSEIEQQKPVEESPVPQKV